MNGFYGGQYYTIFPLVSMADTGLPPVSVQKSFISAGFNSDLMLILLLGMSLL